MFYEKPITLAQAARKLGVQDQLITRRIKEHSLPIQNNGWRWKFNRADLGVLMDHFKEFPKGGTPEQRKQRATAASRARTEASKKTVQPKSLENLKPFKPGQSGNPNGRPATYNRLDDVSVWLIKHGHADAGIALLTEYRP